MKAIVIVLAFLMISCTGLSQRDQQICDPVQNPGAENSLICKTMSPTGTDFSLMLINLEGIKNKIWTKEQAIEFFNEAEALINAGNTWAQLVNHLISRLEVIRDTFGVEIIFLSTYLELPEFSGGGPISDYDVYLLKLHIQHQRERVIALF